MGDLVVVFACELVERQKAFVGVEAEVAACSVQAHDFIGEPPGTRTQGPRLKRSNRPIVISARYCVWFPQNVYFRSVKSGPLASVFSIRSIVSGSF